MKKITLLGLAVVAISFASCKKDRACKCTTTDKDGDVTIDEIKFTKINKRNAKDACSDHTYSYTSGTNVSYSKRECELK